MGLLVGHSNRERCCAFNFVQPIFHIVQLIFNVVQPIFNVVQTIFNMVQLIIYVVQPIFNIVWPIIYVVQPYSIYFRFVSHCLYQFSHLRSNLKLYPSLPFSSPQPIGWGLLRLTYMCMYVCIYLWFLALFESQIREVW